MVHYSNVDDSRNVPQEAEVLMELVEIRDHGWHAEASENDVRLLEDMAQLAVQCSLVVIR